MTEFKVAVVADDSVRRDTDHLISNKMRLHQNLLMGSWLQHTRPAAPHKVSDLFVEHGYESTVFHYMSSWVEEELLTTLENYSEGKPLLCAFSVTFDTTIPYLSFLRNLISKIKERCPGSIAIVGGIRANFNVKEHAVGDVMYRGRSMDLLMKSIHDRMFDNLIGKTFEPLVIEHPNNQNLMDDPVIYKFHDHDLWSDTDVATFETTLGCKFNCTFCNYDFRGIKNPKTAEIDKLTEFFSEANSRGIKHFIAADDTLNETDEKLERIHTAVKESGIQDHTIAAFARQDLMWSKPHQTKLMSEAGITSLFFGIETFSYEASKMIKKGMPGDRVVQNLRNIKEYNPDFYLYGTHILGLTGDSEANIKHYIDLTLSEKLLDGVGVRPLLIRDYGDMHDWEFQSELDTNPQKYGYTIHDQGDGFDNRTTWSNNWATKQGMNVFAVALLEHMIRTYGFNSQISNWSYICLKALGKVSTPTKFKNEFTANVGITMQHTVRKNPIEQAIKQYIENKKMQYSSSSKNS